MQNFILILVLAIMFSQVILTNQQFLDFKRPAKKNQQSRKWSDLKVVVKGSYFSLDAETAFSHR